MAVCHSFSRSCKGVELKDWLSGYRGPETETAAAIRSRGSYSHFLHGASRSAHGRVRSARLHRGQGCIIGSSLGALSARSKRAIFSCSKWQIGDLSHHGPSTILRPGGAVL